MGADPAAEEQFGPYLVYERLGVGGMATVHRALERGIEGFERMVALKRLLPHLAEDASFIKSFVREAKLASILNHVNIVQIFELGRVGTEYFISMEYIDGRDIRRILRHARKVTGPPPIHITVGMLLQLCEALDYAHTKVDDDGRPLLLVHRDVSPSNVLVTSQGHLKIIDFGIAKAQSSQLRTQTGRVKGKLAYMAPEAISGSKDLDARSDLWAVGVIAHELLTARPLFASKNEYQTLLKVQRGDIIPPSTFNPACPPELDAIVAKALERDPDARYSGASEMREALLQLRHKKGMQTGYRDIAAWVDLAFSMEAPSGPTAASTAFENLGARTPTPRPRSRDDDDAVEIAWGGGDPASAEPLVLDDVPDVSSKHLAPAPIVDEIQHTDDIPASVPSHGHTPVPRSATVAGMGAGLGAAARSSGQFPFAIEPRTNPMRRELEAETVPGMAPAPDDGLDAEAAAEPRTEDEADGIDVDVESTPRPQPLPMSPLDSQRIPRTKPGVGEPYRARSPVFLPSELEEPDTIATRRPAPAAGVTIGQAMVARETKPRRVWPIVVGLVVASGVALGATLYATRDQTVEVTPEPGPKLPHKLVGTLKFVTEPADAEIRIEGQPAHVGSPWAIELEVGVHQIEIHHTGYKAWLSSVDVAQNETNTMTVALGPLGTQQAADAMLMLAASSPGLDAVIDGQLLDVKTPIKMPIKSGPHTIALRKDGVEVWRASIAAKAATDYTFDPSFPVAKQRIAAQRVVAPGAGGEERPAPDRPTPPPERIEPVSPPPDARKPDPVVVAPPVEPKKPVVVAPPIAPPPLPQPVVAAGPVLVPPSAVTKLAGEVPHLGVARNVDMPPVVSAKLCIDAEGKVTSAYAITKIEHHAAEDLADVLKTWRYAPYKQGAIAVPACFAVSFRVK